MPGYEALVVRLLDEKAGAPDQNVAADDGFDRIEHLGVAHYLIDPGQEQMAFRAQRAVGQPPRGLDRLELGAVTQSFLRRKNADGREIAVPVVVKGRVLSQCHSRPRCSENSRSAKRCGRHDRAGRAAQKARPYRATWYPCGRRRKSRNNPWDCDL